MRTYPKPFFVEGGAYKAVDPDIYAWAGKHDLEMCTELKEYAVRMVHINDWSIFIQSPKEDDSLNIICNNKVKDEKVVYPASIKTLAKVLDQVYEYVTRI